MQEATVKPSLSRYRSLGMHYIVIAGVAAAVVVGGGGFAAGMQYQKSHQPASAASALAANGQGQFGGGFSRGGMRGTFGQVTAVSSTSITVSELRDNTTKTMSITSATKVTKDGTAASVSDIATGDRVVIQASTSNSSEAAQISINPSMGNGPATMQQDDDDTTTQTN